MDTETTAKGRHSTMNEIVYYMHKLRRKKEVESPKTFLASLINAETQ